MSTPRPLWLQELVVAIGEPSLDVNEWQQMPWGSKRRCWVWFVGALPANHIISIDWFDGKRERFEVCINGINVITLENTEEPTDDLMRKLIEIAELGKSSCS